MRDGNDIRYQLPSSNAGLSLGRNHDDPPKSSMSIKRRKTTRVAAMVRRKSTRPPPVGKSTSYSFYYYCSWEKIAITVSTCKSDFPSRYTSIKI